MLDLAVKLCLNAAMNGKGIHTAIELLGSQAELAQRVGVTPQFICQLASGARPIPARVATAIEVATSGRVSRQDLRPDIFAEAAIEAA